MQSPQPNDPDPDPDPDSWSIRAADAGRVLLYDYDLRTDEIRRTPHVTAIAGVRPGDSERSTEWWLSLVHPDDRGAIAAGLASPGVEGEESYEIEYRIRQPDGSYIPVLDRGKAYTGPDGKRYRFCGGIVDIRDRKERERERDRLLSLIEAAPDLIATATPDGRITYMNPAGRKLLGLPDDLAAAERYIPSTHPEWANARLRDVGFPEAVREGRWQGETAVLTADGREIPVSQVVLTHRGADGRLEFLSTIMRDLRERKEAQRAMQEAERLESLGTLAGGVAHKFNNLLTGILGFASLTGDDAGLSHASRQYLKLIEDSARQASEVCGKMLAFAGRSRINLLPVDLGGLIREQVPTIEAAVPRGVALSVADPSDRLPPVLGDATQLAQLLVYLVANAVEAVTVGTGTIRLAAFADVLDEAHIAEFRVGRDLRPGTYLCLEVADNGHGMDDLTQARLFEPFFSTKFQGRGLGLPAVMGIVRSHGGGLSVESRPRMGTTVRAYFPAAESPAPVAPPDAEPAASLGEVLLIEDEDSVRRFVASVLQIRGYVVRVAGDGVEGLEMVRRHHAKLRLVVLDLIMPRLDGERVLERLVKEHPSLPVVIISGFNEDEIQRRVMGMPIAGFLRKPFPPSALDLLLQNVLPRVSPPA